MEKIGIIFKSYELKKKVPPSCYFNKKMEKEIKDNHNANYYSVNPLVFSSLTKNSGHGTYDKINIDFLLNSSTYFGVRFVQEYQKDPLETIALINTLQKIDYLTILTCMIWICRDMIELLSGGRQDDDVGPAFFNSSKQLKKILRKNCSMWSDDTVEQPVDYDSTGTKNFLEKFERSLETLLIQDIYTERVFQ